MPTTLGRTVEADPRQVPQVQGSIPKIPSWTGHAARHVKALFTLAFGLFALATDLLMAFDLLEKNEQIGSAALLAFIAPYWIPGWIALTWTFGSSLEVPESNKPLSMLLFMVMVLTIPIVGFFFGGLMLGAGLFMAFHGVRLASPFGVVPSPPDDWQFDIYDNSNEYMGWLVELVIGFWVSLVEDIPECIIAAVVIFGGVSDGDVNLAVMSAVTTILNFIWGAFKVAQATSKHRISFVALLTAHVVRKSRPGEVVRAQNARARGRGRR